MVWKMETKEGVLLPAVPAFITTKEIVVKNTIPIEIGYSYKWDYWLSRHLYYRKQYLLEEKKRKRQNQEES